MSNLPFTVAKFINNPRNIENKYIKLRTFDPSISTDIIRAIRGLGGELYFEDQSGSIKVFENNEIKHNLLNAITKRDFVINPDLMIKPNPDSNIVLFYSKPFGTNILRIVSPTRVDLLYNPTSRPEYADYFMGDKSNSISQLYVGCNDTKNIGIDPTCNCFNSRTNPSDQFCMRALFGGDQNLINQLKNKYGPEWNIIVKNCGCASPFCENTPLNQAFRRKSTLNDLNDMECPSDYKIVICNTSFEASEGGSIITEGGVPITQQCGLSESEPTPAPTIRPPTPTTTPPAPTSPPIPTPPAQPPSKINIALFAGGSIFLLILLIILLFVLLRKPKKL